MTKAKRSFKKAGQTPPKGALTEAAVNGNALAVKNLLLRGASVGERNDDGETPLLAAAAAGSKECVRLLIDAQADCNAKDNGGETPLIAAVDRDNAACAELLLQHGAKVDEPRANGMTPLLKAIYNQSAELALLLIGKGAKVDQETSEGEPVLVLSAVQGPAMNVVSMALLNEGAVVNSFGPWGLTPLVAAAINDNVELARFLIRKGADLEKRVDGRTPLETAAAEGSAGVVEVIKEAFADRERERVDAIQKTADSFNTGLKKPIVAGKPLMFKPR